MTPATLECARDAKSKLRLLIADVGAVRGIGIAVLDGGYGVKVNLLHALPAGVIPDDVDGVPVIVDVIGNVTSR